MSNNKQSMKLYTEEQVRQIFENLNISSGYDYNMELYCSSITPIELPSDSLCINCDESKSTHNVCIDCMIKIGKENIELPSDEDINKNGYHDKESDDIFREGVKYVINKIQRGNNEQ